MFVQKLFHLRSDFVRLEQRPRSDGLSRKREWGWRKNVSKIRFVHLITNSLFACKTFITSWQTQRDDNYKIQESSNILLRKVCRTSFIQIDEKSRINVMLFHGNQGNKRLAIKNVSHFSGKRGLSYVTGHVLGKPFSSVQGYVRKNRQVLLKDSTNE